MKVLFTTSARKLLAHLPEEDRLKVESSIAALRLRLWSEVEVRHLRGDVKELKIGEYRFIFTIIDKHDLMYGISMFKKQSRKTPLREIRKAENAVRRLLGTLGENQP